MTHEVKHSEKRLLSKHRPITSHRNCTKMYIVFLCLLENILTFPKLLYFSFALTVCSEDREKTAASSLHQDELSGEAGIC